MKNAWILVVVFTFALMVVIAASVFLDQASALNSSIPVVPTDRSGSVVDEQGDPYSLLLTSTVETGQVITMRVKASPTPDGSTPIGRVPITPVPAQKQVWQHNIYLPIVRVSGYNLKVFVVAYISETGETRDPGVPVTPSVAVDDLTGKLIADLRLGSTWHGYAISGTPMLNFATYSVTKLYEQAPYLSNGRFDYDALYNRFNICALGVDEVWVWGNQSTGMVESVVNGPTWSMTTGSLPNCGKTMTTFGFNYYRNVASAIHSYVHSIEYMMQLYPVAGPEACDFGTSHFSMAIFGIPAECTGAMAVNDTYGFTARAWSDTNGNVGVCGWMHQPPNQPLQESIGNPQSRYIWVITSTVQDRCADWVWGGSGTTSFTCYTYGCDPWLGDPGDVYQWSVHNIYSEEKFAIWWMQNIPGDGNTSKNRLGLNRPNWWAIKFR